MATEHKKVRLPEDRQPTLRVVPMPHDTNQAGSIFGGWILAQIDIAGSIPALCRARGRVATVAVNSVEFHQPVFVGDLVSLYAEVVKVGHTSITVQVDVYATRNIEALETIRVTQAVLTYVALDENRQPRPVPPLNEESQ